MLGNIAAVFGGVIAIAVFMVMVVLPIHAGQWAIDRFGSPHSKDAVVLRQDKYSKPLFICADGPDAAPTHCLDVPTMLELARTHGVPYDPKRLAR